MKKKLLVLLSAVLIGLAFHACSMPNSINRPKKIKVKGSLDYDLLLNITNVDLNIIYEKMKHLFINELPEGFQIFDAPYYKNGAVQAFLLYYERTLLNSFNPDDYFEIPEFGSGGEAGEVNEEIEIPELSYEYKPDENPRIDLKDIFKGITDTINDAQKNNVIKELDLVALGLPVNLGPFNFVFDKTIPATPARQYLSRWFFTREH
jgi:hypothetical protein